MIRKALTIFVTVFVAADLLAEKPDEQELGAARQKYEQAVAPGSEAARLVYVNKLAQILDRIAPENLNAQDEDADPVYAELKKHLAPQNSDSKKLSQLMVGSWAFRAPGRFREYVFNRDGTYGRGADGMRRSSHCRFKGNQPNPEQGSPSTITFLSSKYFIYVEGDRVHFHSR